MAGSYIIDAIVVLLVLGMVVTNARRGFAKSAVAVIGGIISIMLAAVLSASLAPVIYDNYMSENVTKNLAKRMSEYDSAEVISDKLFKEQYGVTVSPELVRSALLSSGDTEKQLLALFKSEAGVTVKSKEISDFFEKEGFELLKEKEGENIYADKSDKIFEVIRAFAVKDRMERVEKVEEVVARPLIIQVIRLLLAVFLFLVLSAIIKKVAEIFDFVDRMPVLGAMNTILGGLLGVAEAIMMIFVFTFAIKALFLMGSDLISESAIDHTRIFRLFYNLNI